MIVQVLSGFLVRREVGMNLFLASALFFLLTAPTAFSAALIGPESVLPFPPSAKYNLILNDRPRDGELVTLNPPRISWSHSPNPTNSHRDGTPREFQFQVAYDPSFASPVVNVRTKQNAYNFLAPFNNPLVSSNIVYWRVIYVNATNQTTNFLGPMRSFVIAPGATVWDRSMLASEDYWRSKAVHPRIMFNAETRPVLSNWLTTNLSPQVKPHWEVTKQYAYRAITNSWWTMPDPTPRGPRGPEGLHAGNWGHEVFRVAFVWQMTRDPRFITGPADVRQRASDIATYITTNNFEFYDPVVLQTSDLIKCVGLCYDWLYEVMTDNQKSNLLHVIERCARFTLKGTSAFEYPVRSDRVDWFSPGQTPFANYTNGFYVDSGSVQKRGSNHPLSWHMLHWVCALSAYEDGPMSRELLERTLQTQISRPLNFGDDGHANAGRGYSAEFLFSSDMLLNHMICATVFPEVQFNKNPYWAELAEWQSRVLPVDFYERYEPWGDLGMGGYLYFWRQLNVGRDLAAFTGDGKALLHWKNAEAAYGATGWGETALRLPITFHFPLPTTPVTNTVTAKAYPYGGWVMGSTYEPNTKRGFNQGAGFIIKASPTGWTGSGHDSPSDLDLQLWAFGAPLTESGYGFASQSKIGWLRNVPAFNGYSLFNAGTPYSEYYSRILAFTNNADFTYTAIDGTGAYPTRKFDGDAGGWIMPGAYAERHRSGGASSLTKMHRHLLFMRKKYFVLLDDMAAQNNSTFSWIWQIPNPGLSISNFSFTYPATNPVTRSNVTVRLVLAADPATITLANQSGRAVFQNPISGEDYTPGTTFTGNGALPGAQAQVYINVYYKGVGQSATFTWTSDPSLADKTTVYAGSSGAESLTNFFQALSNYPWSSFAPAWNTFAGFQMDWKSPSVFRMSIRTADLTDCTYLDASAAYAPISANTIGPVVPRANALWVNNASPAKKFQFLTVVYPVKPGDSQPTITRLDDLTVSVVNGTEQDIISFDPATTFPATVVVNVAAVQPPAAPGPVGVRPSTPARPIVNLQ